MISKDEYELLKTVKKTLSFDVSQHPEEYYFFSEEKLIRETNILNKNGTTVKGYNLTLKGNKLVDEYKDYRRQKIRDIISLVFAIVVGTATIVCCVIDCLNFFCRS